MAWLKGSEAAGALLTVFSGAGFAGAGGAGAAAEVAAGALVAGAGAAVVGSLTFLSTAGVGAAVATLVFVVLGLTLTGLVAVALVAAVAEAAFCRAASARRAASWARFSASLILACWALLKFSVTWVIFSSRMAIFWFISAILPSCSVRRAATEVCRPAMFSLVSSRNWLVWAEVSSMVERMRWVSPSTWSILLTELACRFCIWSTALFRTSSTF